MKGFFTVMTGILFLCMVLFPVMAINPPEDVSKTSSVTEQKETIKTESFKVKLIESGKIKTIERDEYILGVLAGEMPASYEKEALKAQAVAAYTYASVKKNNTKEKFDVTNSETTDQRYLTKKERKQKWGKNFEKYESKLKDAVKSVEGQMIYYNDEPITAVYHAISCGKTENAQNVWGSSYPYLKAVESVGDLLSDDYLSVAEFEVSEFKNILKKKNVKLPKKTEKWIGKSTKTKSGTTKTIVIGDKTFKGTEIREMFSLRSAAFDLEYKNDKFIFNVKGYGHMLGLSQFGSNYMAKQGSNYKEILLWYYSGCKLVKVEI